MLQHAARRAAGAAGVDDAGEVVAADARRRAARAPRRRPSPATSSAQWWISTSSGAWPVRMSSMPMTCWHSDDDQHRRQQRLRQLLGRDDHRAGARIVEDVLVVALGVGGVGRHGDAARGHDREVGDQPFGPVLADQHHPVAGLRARCRCSAAASAATCRAASRQLIGRHAPSALGPQERRVALLAARARNIATRLAKCSSCAGALLRRCIR